MNFISFYFIFLFSLFCLFFILRFLLENSSVNLFLLFSLYVLPYALTRLPFLLQIHLRLIKNCQLSIISSIYMSEVLFFAIFFFFFFFVFAFSFCVFVYVNVLFHLSKWQLYHTGVVFKCYFSYCPYKM